MNTAPLKNKKKIANTILSVQSVTQLSAHFIRVTFKNSEVLDLDSNWIGPHLKLLFPQPCSESGGDKIIFPELDENGKVIWRDGGRKWVRTYSIRDYHHADNLLTVDFAIHEDGTATRWVKQAKKGDRIGLIRYGSKTQYDESKHIVMLGDIAAMPAICYTLEHAPEHQQLTAIVELPSEADKQNITTENNKKIHWVIRAEGAESQLLDVISQLQLGENDKPIYFWGGMETAIAQQLRHYLKDRYAMLSGSDIQLTSYWRNGFAEGEFKHSD